jgi:hypothetical protein
LKQGQEDLTTEVIKSLPTSGRITPDNLAPAIFPSLDAGIGAIDRQLELYSRNNINTPEALANTYLGSGNKENSPENRAGYIDAIKSVAGESFNLGNPATRDAIKNAIVNQEFGSAGANVMADMRRGTDASILGNLNLQQLGANLPVTSDVNQLGSLDPIGQTQTRSQIPDVLPDISEESFRTGQGSNIRSGTTQVGPGGRFTFSETPGRRIGSLAQRIPLSPDVYSEGSFDIGGTAPTLTTGLIGDNIVGSDVANLATETQNISPENTAARIARNNRTINEIRADLGSRVPDTALETLQGARGERPVQGPPQMPDTVFDIDTTFDPITLDDRLTTVPPDTLGRIGREQRVDDANTFRQTVPDAARIFGGRTIDTTPTTTTNLARGPDVSIVGDDVVPSLDIADIQGDVTQERVADILNRPDRFKDTFTIGDVEFPNLIATLANKVGSFFDRRLFDGIVNRGLDAVVDPDTGRIIGAKNELGQLIEGRDLDQFKQDDSGGDDPVTTFLKKATEDKKEEEKDTPPNVFGSTVASTRAERPVVVESPFRQSTASFTPVGFESGSLNDLIARITGLPSPRRMQDGGVINAVDNFLTKVA